MKNTFCSFFVLFWVGFFLFTRCNSIQQVNASRKLNETFRRTEIFNNQFTGFVLYDPLTHKYLKEVNADLHFTPASNNKILTTYACLTTLGDSIPTFLSQRKNDTLQLSPFGDPTLLHTDFPNQPALRKIDQSPLELYIPSAPLEHFGPGWAWDDYQYSFQSERSWIPVYGNEVRISNRDSLLVVPMFFSNYVNKHIGTKPENMAYRHRRFNLFNIWLKNDTSDFNHKIPFQWSQELASKLLADTVHNTVSMRSDQPIFQNPDTIFNQKTMPTIALMMQRSDNFLAEQLLIVSARVSGYSNIDAYRNHLINRWNLPSPIRWVDGSGLSRYNLITPRTFIAILDRMYADLSWNEIKWIFPNGGYSGTLRNWYPGDPTYIFAKTGTLSNNHCLSGYLVTNSGKTLIFSFMNNHFLTPLSDLKKEMQKVLEEIRDHY